MLSLQAKRNFSSSNLNKTVCIMANSYSSDLTGSKIMKALKEVSGQDDLKFYGYGG